MAKTIKASLAFGILISFFLMSCKKEVTVTKKAKPELILQAGDGRLSADNLHLVKDTVYILASNLNRTTGQTVVIDAGTLIKVRRLVAIDIKPGGKIEANGTKDDPVIFTVEAAKGAAGKRVNQLDLQKDKYWYGISISGSSGLSSGNLNFVRVEFAGGRRDLPGEASLVFYNVDALTTIQNVEVSYSYDLPAFGFSGGNVNAFNLVSYASLGSDFVIENGYTGKLQNLLAYRHTFFASFCAGSTLGVACNGLDLAGMLIKGDNSRPSISNLTVLGPGVTQPGTGSKYFDTSFINGSAGRVAGLLIRGGKFYMRNSVIAGFPKTGFHIDNGISARSLNFDESEFSSSIVHCNDTSRTFYLTPRIYPPNTSADFKQFILRPVYKNRQINSFDVLGFTNPFNYDVAPNPLPKPGSPLLTGASFDGTIFSNSFFKPVPHVGALGSEDWMGGWVNFLPLQTDYNN